MIVRGRLEGTVGSRWDILAFGSESFGANTAAKIQFLTFEFPEP
jgi:hypothetical protein